MNMEGGRNLYAVWEWRNITEITDSNMTYIGTVKSGRCQENLQRPSKVETILKAHKHENFAGFTEQKRLRFPSVTKTYLLLQAPCCWSLCFLCYTAVDYTKAELLLLLASLDSWCCLNPCYLMFPFCCWYYCWQPFFASGPTNIAVVDITVVASFTAVGWRRWFRWHPCFWTRTVYV
jgi:hypothetical protein